MVTRIEGVHPTSGGREAIFFSGPLAERLFLDHSAKAGLRAAQLRQQVLRAVREGGDRSWFVIDAAEGKTMDCITSEATSVIFATMALEVFANRSLSVVPGGIVDGTSVKHAEEKWPLRSKLTHVLPASFDGYQVDDEVLDRVDDIARLRNRLIHHKPSDRYSVGGEAPPVETSMGSLLKEASGAALFVGLLIEAFVPAIVPDPTAQTLRELAKLAGMERQLSIIDPSGERVAMTPREPGDQFARGGSILIRDLP